MSSHASSAQRVRSPRRGGGASQDPLIGMIVEGRVYEARIDTCWVHFDDPLDTLRGSKPRTLVARLHQDYSRAQFDVKPLEALSTYRRGNRLRVYLRGVRQTAAGHTVYYAHERRAQPGNNPWDEPPLPNLAILLGTVVRKTERDNVLTGYVLQLDTNLNALDRDGNPLDQRQHDIEVFLPLADIPEVKSKADAMDGRTRRSWVGSRRYRLRAPRALGHIVRTAPGLLERRGELVRHGCVSRPFGFTLLELLPSAAGEALIGESSRGHGELSNEAVSAATAAFPTGTHCILVDDQETVLQEMGALLAAAGAEVTSCHVDSRAGTGLDGVAKRLFDATKQATAMGQTSLCLVDYSLPTPGQGLAVMRRVHVLCMEHQVPVPRWILISTSLPPEPASTAELRSQGLVAALARPLNLDEVVALTSADREGPWHWLKPEELRFGDRERACESSLDLLTHAHQPPLRFAVVLEVLTVGKLAWRASAGSPPVGLGDLDLMLRDTELRTLVRGRVDQFATAHGDVHLFHQGGVKHTLWQGFGQRPGGGPEWVLGVGSSLRLNPSDPQWFLWQTTLGQAVMLEAWRSWAVAQSSFVVQGRLVNSLAHEVNNHHDSMLRQIELATIALAAGKQAVALNGLTAIRETVVREQRLADALLRGLREREAHCSFPQLLLHVAQLHQQAAHDAGVDLRVESDLVLTLALPSSYMVAALSNLILNALKHHHRAQAAWVTWGCAGARRR